MYSIKDTAEITNVSSYTLRYYEKEEILFPKRDEHGNRTYSEQDIKWIKFVVRLKNSQMPITKIKEYTKLFLEGEHTNQQRLAILEEHNENIRHQIELLEIVKKELDYKIENYYELIKEANLKLDKKSKP